MAETSPNLLLPFIQSAQAQKHVTHNEAIARLDNLTQLRLQRVEAITPPAAPEAGHIYALGTGATGDWAGWDKTLAIYEDTAWVFEPPQDGWLAVNLDTDELVIWRQGNWQAAVLAETELEQLGINTTPNATNRLAVASDASLFTHVGADHQLKLNKAAANDTGTLLFQTGFSGRAEMGLAGDDNWSVKVSPDGTNWQNALRINATTGAVGVGPGADTTHQFSVAADTVEPTIVVHNTGGTGGASVRVIDDSSGSDWKLSATVTGDFKVRNEATSADHLLLRTASSATEFMGPMIGASYTVATLPIPSTIGAGAMIYVSDETGGAVMAFCDGIAWRRVTDRAVVS